MRLFILFTGIVLLTSAHLLAAPPTPPAQPKTGPGSSDYSHAEMISHVYGEGDTQFWIFEPADPKPATAPVIIFCHGWSAMSPNTYGAWIEHLVRRGNIVIYPRYQATLLTSMQTFTPSAEAAVKEAFKELEGKVHVKPELDHVAIVGHSMGGAVGPNLAMLMPADGLPTPKAICSIEPGYRLIGQDKVQMSLEDFSKIPAGTLVQMIVGQDDMVEGDADAKDIFARFKQIAAANKNFITLVSDEHGQPKLSAGHMAPVAMKSIVEADEAKPTTKKAGPVRERLMERVQEKNGAAAGDGAAKQAGGGIGIDAMDYYGTWKLFDALTDAAFHGKNRDIALGNTPQQKFMGKWSNGVPVKELIVTEKP